MSKKQIILFLAAILLLACFFRLWQLDSIPPGFYHDEAMNANNALEAIEADEFKWFYTENNGREGLYINIVGLSLKIFGNESWALRSVSALFGILTVLGLFLLTKELFNSRIALFSSFFLSVSFWHILFSRIGFRAIMAPMFLVWSMWLLWRILKKTETANFDLGCGRAPERSEGGDKRSKLAVSAIISGLLFGLGFHSYIAYRIAPLLLILPFIILWKGKQKKIIAVFLLGAFIAGLPLGLYFLENPADFFGRTSQISIFSSESPVKDLTINTAKTIGMLFFIGDYNWRHNLAGAPQLFWPVAILFLIGILKFGIWDLIKNLEFKIIFLLSWLVLFSLPIVISNEGLPHALRAIILIPPIMIFAGIGLEFIVRKINKKLAILLFIFFLLIASHSYNQYFLRWGENIYTYHAFNGRYWDIGNYLKTLSPEIKKYVVVNASGVKVDGIPMPAQTIMFAAKDITYLLPKEIDSIKCPGSCVVATMEIDGPLREEIKKQIPGIELDIKPGFEILVLWLLSRDQPDNILKSD